MILKGSLDRTFAAVTDFKDDKDKEIIIAVEINKSRAFGEVNKISSVYGREDFPQYIKDNLKANNIIAIDIKKLTKCFIPQGQISPRRTHSLALIAVQHIPQGTSSIHRKNLKEPQGTKGNEN